MSSDSYTRIAVICEDCDGVQVARRMPDGTLRLYTGPTCPCGGAEFADLTDASESALRR